MPVRAAVSYNLQTESFAAGRQVGEDIVAQLGGEEPDFLMVFLTVGHDIDQVIRGLYSITGEVPLCGASGAGVITNRGCDEAIHSIGVMAMKAASVRFSTFLFPGLSTDPVGIGEDIARHVKESGAKPGEPQLLVLLPDGFTINADAVYKGIARELGYHIDIVGGTAGNDHQISKTFQLCGSRVASDSIAGGLLCGDFTYQIGVSHGSKPVGLLRTVTRARSNVIYEIDGNPALDLLASFIGAERIKDFGSSLNMFELGEAFDGKGYSQDILNRGIISVDENEGSITLAVEIAEGAKVRISHRDDELVLQRTREKAREILDAMKRPDDGAYWFFECDGRGSQLFGEHDTDVEALLGVTGRDKPILGFYTFGELAPVAGKNYFHNYTAVFVGIE